VLCAIEEDDFSLKDFRNPNVWEKAGKNSPLEKGGRGL